MNTGYSDTPLIRKLGIKSSYRVKTKNAPDNYLQLLAPVPDGVHISARIKGNIDIWHVFTSSRRELNTVLAAACSDMKQDGAIWVSWPKRSSGVVSEITEGTVREEAFPLGLVDVKVCAVDNTWSALKLVIRKELRRRD